MYLLLASVSVQFAVVGAPAYICGRVEGVNSLWGANANIQMAACPYFPCGIEVNEQWYVALECISLTF